MMIDQREILGNIRSALQTKMAESAIEAVRLARDIPVMFQGTSLAMRETRDRLNQKRLARQTTVSGLQTAVELVEAILDPEYQAKPIISFDSMATRILNQTQLNTPRMAIGSAEELWRLHELGVLPSAEPNIY